MNIKEFALSRPQRSWHIEIPGEPQTWKRKGGSGNRSFNPSREHQKDIAWSVKASCPELRSEDKFQKWGARFVFYSCNLATSDVDNLIKNFFDALNNRGMCWVDDRQVREIYAVIVPAKRPRTELLLYHVSEDYLAARSELE
jgi:Holliday junction resolvase RusA-like endonuclease